jgi:hypothetical protein
MADNVIPFPVRRRAPPPLLPDDLAHMALDATAKALLDLMNEPPPRSLIENLLMD